ncbi:hypothetical protein [Amycolatopsis sp. CA-126428]|uniref:hypothetical protein n=1 Tax=Amycolatopsis sp. CA-126428 TaxID=2073158 RepID=UPI0011B05FDE|nr:hypothetical protein [Amycolatopsis sp. CA-126428]
MTAGTIDDEARTFFGHGFCLFLSGAIYSLVNVDICTVYVRRPGEGHFRPVHSGVITPDGRFLDIFGHRTTDTIKAAYREAFGGDVYLRTVDGQYYHAEVTDVDEDSCDTRWWQEEFDTPAKQAVLLHFARLLLHKSGYGDRIPLMARPELRARTPQKPVARKPCPRPAAPTRKETGMSIPEDVARLNALAGSIPLGQLQQLSEAELPPELLDARRALSESGDARSILGGTQEAAEADNALSHAVAKLDQATEVYQMFKSHLTEAFQAAARAKQHIEQAAGYHGRGL